MNEYWERADHSWTKDSLRFIVTPTKKSKELFYYIQEIGHFKAQKPYYTERANLPSYLIKYTLSGEGKLIYQNQVHQVKEGDVFFIDCRNYQHYATCSDEPWKMDWIHFDGGNAQAFYQEFIRAGSNVFHSHNQKIHQLLTKLLHLQKDQTAKTDFGSSLLIHELLNEMILQKYQLDFSHHEIPAYIKETKIYLDAHFTRAITLQHLEKRFNINKYQLTKEFSKFIGVPPIEYHIANKISYSKDLLRYSNDSIKEIAISVGLENVAYFSRLFKKKTGLSPSQYRKNG